MATTTFSDVPLLLEIFCWNDPKSRFNFHLISNQISQKLFVNGKQPKVPCEMPLYSIP